MSSFDREECDRAFPDARMDGSPSLSLPPYHNFAVYLSRKARKERKEPTAFLFPFHPKAALAAAVLLLLLLERTTPNVAANLHRTEGC